MNRNSVRVSALLFALSLLLACGTTESRQAGDEADAAQFVRGVYAAYLPRSERSGIGALDSLILEQPESFSDSLRAGLLRDASRRRENPGEIVGLDFDPLLASQDPCEDYVPGTAIRVDSLVRVAIHSVCQGVRSADAVVVAEMVRRGTQWQFTNFIYEPSAGDLLQILHSNERR
ncbi:MAG: hypothetical protein IBJ03_02415 [Gemmatimonadaceae bacterium]|nr:hypothetical protein [Gemmatimonadaceae bacterium]